MEKHYKSVTDPEELAAYLSGPGPYAWDYETAANREWRDDPKAALDPHKAYVTDCSYSRAPHEGITVPIAHLTGRNMDPDVFWKIHKEFVQDRTKVKICHNLAFESAFTYAQGIVIQAPVYDTICASQMTLKSNFEFRKLQDSGLKNLAQHLLHEDVRTFEEVSGGRPFDEMDAQDPMVVQYSCADSDYTIQLYDLFNSWFRQYLPKHEWIVRNEESPSAIYVGMMQYNGIPVDVPVMEAGKKKAAEEIGRLKNKISFMIGDVEIGSNCSTISFRNYLYNDLGLPVLKRTDKGAPALDDEAMIKLRDYCKDRKPELVPLFQLVMDYRKWTKLNSTYLDGYLKFVNPATGNIHPHFYQLATETGRFACRQPNMQNQVAPGADPIGVRDFISAPEGWLVMEADYSQAEIRLAAYLSDDRVLLDAYRQGQDVHAITTSAIFGISIDEAKDHHNLQYKHRRTVAKATMFGIMYGIGPVGLSRNLYTNAGVNLTKEQCADYIDGVLNHYKRLAAWQNEAKEYARRHLYTETAVGRRRYLPDINSDEYGPRGSAERMAINTPVQGLGADCLKLSMARLVEALKDRPYMKPCLTVHDSLVFIVEESHRDEAVALVKRCMETPPPLDNFMPLVADVSVGKKYGEMD